MLKQLLTFNYENRWLFALKFALVTAPVQFGLVPLVPFLFKILLGMDGLEGEYGAVIRIYVTPITVILALLIYRYRSGLILRWRDFIYTGMITAVFIGFANGFIEQAYDAINYPEGSFSRRNFSWLAHMGSTFITGTLTAIFTGIYLDRTSGAIKFKRTMSVILFVWFLFNLVTGGDSEPEEAPDHVALDTDGDGIKDTIAMDTNKDGLIDSVASDTSGDGKIDTVILDSNHDGRADVTLRDRDGDGRPDGIA